MQPLLIASAIISLLIIALIACFIWAVFQNQKLKAQNLVLRTKNQTAAGQLEAFADQFKNLMDHFDSLHTEVDDYRTKYEGLLRLQQMTKIPVYLQGRLTDATSNLLHAKISDGDMPFNDFLSLMLPALAEMDMALQAYIKQANPTEVDYNALRDIVIYCRTSFTILEGLLKRWDIHLETPPTLIPFDIKVHYNHTQPKGTIDLRKEYGPRPGDDYFKVPKDQQGY